MALRPTWNFVGLIWQIWLHSLRSVDKKYFLVPLLVLQLVTHRDWCQYLEGPISTSWRDHNRNIFILLDPYIPIAVLPGTDWSFQVLPQVPYLWQAEVPIPVLEGTSCSSIVSSFCMSSIFSRRYTPMWKLFHRVIVFKLLLIMKIVQVEYACISKTDKDP